MSEAAQLSIRAESRVRDASFVMSGHHCHQCSELFYVESGACRFLVDENIVDLHSGDFIMIPPMVVHYTRYLFGACKRTVVLFERDDVSALALEHIPGGERFLNETGIFQVPEAYRADTVRYLEQLSAEEKICDPHSAAIQQTALQALFLLCSRVCDFLSDPPKEIHTTDPHILQAARYISAHYMQPLTTAEIADKVGFSPNYLSRRFRQETGIGLHEYIVFIRLHRAALELVATEDSVTTVAFRCGFSDSNYFKDAFKKKYGVTPRAYRKRA